VQDDPLDAMFREHWRAVLAALVRFTGSPEVAEDCVQEAFARVARTRNREVLLNPRAWLITAAQRIAIDAARREASLRERLPSLVAARPADVLPAGTGDDRLDLLLVSADPGLAPETRLALALRFVGGVPTADIAGLLLVSPTAMSARLTRAKREVERRGLARNEADDVARVPDAIVTTSLLYTAAQDARLRLDPRGDELATTAVQLARALRRIAPQDPEAAGLLALLLFTEARRPTRDDGDGGLVSLDEADRGRWDSALVSEALPLATEALEGGGRLGMQAAIAGLHSTAESFEDTDWASILTLYDGLVAAWPSPAARLARIVALGRQPAGPDRAIAELDRLAPRLPRSLRRDVAATRADLLRQADRREEAIAAYEDAARDEDRAPVLALYRRRIASLRDVPPAFGTPRRPGVDSRNHD
jgi:RNA polymerase sigma-70 factor (ECF subfamily)